jgi:hypothetical protein
MVKDRPPQHPKNYRKPENGFSLGVTSMPRVAKMATKNLEHHENLVSNAGFSW